MVLPISALSKRIIRIAFAPIAVAFCTSRSSAWRRASSSICVYSWISPPTIDRSAATRLPPRPLLRTTTPKHCPSIRTVRCPVTFSVVTTINCPSYLPQCPSRADAIMHPASRDADQRSVTIPLAGGGRRAAPGEGTLHGFGARRVAPPPTLSERALLVSAPQAGRGSPATVVPHVTAND